MKSFMKPYGIIYKATCLINGKPYIGQTIEMLSVRQSKHKWSSNCKNDKLKKYFQRAIKKHGIENFKWEILCECSSRAVLNEMETQMIIKHMSHVMFKKGYNLTWGGEGITGLKHTEETKKLCGDATRGKKRSEESRKSQGETNKNKI